MKKISVITIRIDTEVDTEIRTLARADDRSVAWVARKLITEALQARRLLKTRNDQEEQADKS